MLVTNQTELTVAELRRVSLLILLAVVGCTLGCGSSQGSYGEFLAEREEAYLERVAEVFKDQGNVSLSASGRHHVGFIEALSMIEPPSQFKGRHDNLIDVHSLNAKVKLHLERLEPFEQQELRRRGIDDIVKCSRVFDDLSTEVSSEYRFACSVQISADSILLHEMSEWEIGIFEKMTGDPYGLRE